MQVGSYYLLCHTDDEHVKTAVPTIVRQTSCLLNQYRSDKQYRLLLSTLEHYVLLPHGLKSIAYMAKVGIMCDVIAFLETSN